MQQLTLSDGTANGGQEAEDCRDKDGSSTTEELVQRVRAPTPTSERSTRVMYGRERGAWCYGHEGRGDVWTGVNQALIPLISGGVWVGLAIDGG